MENLIVLAWIIVPFLFFVAIGQIRRNVSISAENSKIAAGVASRATDIRCPRCSEFVSAFAEVCKHCGAGLSQEDPNVRSQILALLKAQNYRKASQQANAEIVGYIVVFAFIVLGLFFASFVSPVFSSSIEVQSVLSGLGVLALVVGFVFISRLREKKLSAGLELLNKNLDQ
jgi:small-conductance mechanosensitive channel